MFTEDDSIKVHRNKYVAFREEGGEWGGANMTLIGIKLHAGAKRATATEPRQVQWVFG